MIEALWREWSLSTIFSHKVLQTIQRWQIWKVSYVYLPFLKKCKSGTKLHCQFQLFLNWNENTVLWFLYSPFVLELVKRLNFNNRVFCVCIEAVIEVHIVHFELQLGKKASRSHVLKMHNKLVEKWALLLATAYLDTKSELTLIFCISQVANNFAKYKLLRNACLFGEADEIRVFIRHHCPTFTTN